jgi:tetratricopeptide (TPR) repeat protein
LAVVEDRWLKTAYSYLFIRDFEKAMDTFRNAICSNPQNPAYYFHASITAVRSGNLSEAIAWAEAATTLEPDNDLYMQHWHVIRARLLVKEGLEMLQCGRLAEAQELFASALNHDPLNEDAEYFVSHCDFPSSSRDETEQPLP